MSSLTEHFLWYTKKCNLPLFPFLSAEVRTVSLEFARLSPPILLILTMAFHLKKGQPQFNNVNRRPGQTLNKLIPITYNSDFLPSTFHFLFPILYTLQAVFALP